MIPTPKNGSISSNRIVWWIVASLFTLLVIAVSAISSFRQSMAEDFDESLDYIGRKVQDESVINAKQEVEITGMREDMREVKGEVKKIESMTREIYRFTVGK